MPFRLEVIARPKVRDTRGLAAAAGIRSFLGIEVKAVRVRRIFLVDAPLSDAEIDRVREEFTDPVVEASRVGASSLGAAHWCVRVGYRPGVTDNVGRTARTAIEDILGRRLPSESSVHTASEYLLDAADLDRATVERIGRELLANEVIETLEVFSHDDWDRAGEKIVIPRLDAGDGVRVDEVALPEDDDGLARISRDRLLSLSLDEMRTIRRHYAEPSPAARRTEQGLPRHPTDAEIECLAQTWSEHCKHKIFNARIRYIDEFGGEQVIDGLFPTYIRKATELLGRECDWLVSVFHDNAGVIRLNDRVLLSFKVETHNSPSALDPYGGAITGIVGVNRDSFGTGRGFTLLANTWGYCFASPNHEGKVPAGLFHPRRIREGVHQGVVDGGNQSGIPYGFGWERFDERYLGKPLVFCGTVGVAPVAVAGEPVHVKVVRPDDRVVMVGGRIGKDGIHGATFSSAELNEESPVQAVQLGDPITQKKMTDFLLEARDTGLYTAITDNGAGGLSSSVGEMCTLSGGAEIDLERAPLKYAGLQPWEILLSEAQERMTLAVPADRLEAFLALAERREVEATDLGTFTDSGRFVVRYGAALVADLDLAFLHDGVPRMNLTARWSPPNHDEPRIEEEPSPDAVLPALLGDLDVASTETRCRRYDHEVKGLTVVKPFVGVHRDIPADATVFMAEHGGPDGIVLSAGINPYLSDIDTYAMTASCIDEAVRRAIAAGADPLHLAGIDNFCWPDPLPAPGNPDAEYKLAQLVRANQALFDVTTVYRVPCISGKDSMKNDSVRGGVRISIPPTVLFSVIGRIEDVEKAMTPEAKQEGDLVYVAGLTHAELGGSLYYRYLGATTRGRPFAGNKPPRLRPREHLALYEHVAAAIRRGWIRSATAPVLGGIGLSLARVALGGRLGLDVDVGAAPHDGKLTVNEALFSESNGRFVLTVPPTARTQLEQAFADLPVACVGRVTTDKRLVVRGENGERLVDLDLADLERAWKTPFGEMP